jgi:hypothetical protein
MGMVVPITEPKPMPGLEPGMQKPSPVMLAIAAAHMHEQGRLFEPIPSTPEVVDGAK